MKIENKHSDIPRCIDVRARECVC